MKSAFLLTFAVCLGCSFNHIWGSGSQEPLVPKEAALVLAVETTGRCYLTIDQFITNHMNPLFEEFLFVCSAESDEEIELSDSSKTKNALFIKKTHKNSKTPSDEDVIYYHYKCKREVMPSIIHIGNDRNNESVGLYLVGYEVFLGDKSTSYEINSFDSAQLTDKRFAWFNVYTIAFDHLTKSVQSVFSHVLNNPDYMVLPPQEINVSDYVFGASVFFNDIRISYVYSQAYQQRIFAEDIFKDKALPITYVNFKQNRRFMAIHLAQLDGFGSSALKRTAQNYGNISLMWNIVYNNSWWNIETHVALLALGLSRINVITGIYGTLQLSGVDIYYLPYYKQVKVPAAFFKIISYSPNNDEKYSIVIATSNNPYDENDRAIENICKQNQCEQFGWEYVEQEYLGMGRTTCCELTKEVLTELKMLSYESLVDKTLDLNKVPHWSTDRLTLDVKSFIENQINGKEVSKPADDYIYQNDKALVVQNRDTEIALKKFNSVLYSNYVKPYFASKDNINVESAVEIKNPRAYTIA